MRLLSEHPVFTEHLLPNSHLSAARQKEQQQIIKGRFFQCRSTDPFIYIGGEYARVLKRDREDFGR